MATPQSSQSFYAPVAQYPASKSFTACSFGYRGTGESRQGGMRSVRADLADGYLRDLDAWPILPRPLAATSRLRKSIFQSVEKSQA